MIWDPCFSTIMKLYKIKLLVAANFLFIVYNIVIYRFLFGWCSSLDWQLIRMNLRLLQQHFDHSSHQPHLQRIIKDNNFIVYRKRQSRFQSLVKSFSSQLANLLAFGCLIVLHFSTHCLLLDENLFKFYATK